MNQPFRLPPRGPVQAYQTYRIDAPRATHTRAATCAEIDCPHYLNGWATSVLPGSQDEAVIKASGRRWDDRLSEKTADGFMRYVFPSGQSCFRASAHRVSLERDPIFSVVAGDHRVTGQPPLLRRHASAEDWRDDFAEHQQGIADAVQRG